jgi:hypothetical protein
MPRLQVESASIVVRLALRQSAGGWSIGMADCRTVPRSYGALPAWASARREFLNTACDEVGKHHAFTGAGRFRIGRRLLPDAIAATEQLNRDRPSRSQTLEAAFFPISAGSSSQKQRPEGSERHPAISTSRQFIILGSAPENSGGSNFRRYGMD